MVWSLNKDDDGLEGVAVASQSLTASVPSGPGQVVDAPSVVVDPHSQIPEPLHGAMRAGKAVEATEVLKGRRLDDLRAEVRRRRSAHRRKKLLGLMIWAVAGAGALGAGAFVAGRVLSLSEEEPPGQANAPPRGNAEAPPKGDAKAQSLPSGTAAQSPREPSVPVVTPPPDSEKAVSRRAKEVEPEEEVALPDLGGPESGADAPRKQAQEEPAPSGEDGAFTLDDFPVE